MPANDYPMLEKMKEKWAPMLGLNKVHWARFPDYPTAYETGMRTGALPKLPMLPRLPRISDWIPMQPISTPTGALFYEEYEKMKKQYEGMKKEEKEKMMTQEKPVVAQEPVTEEKPLEEKEIPKVYQGILGDIVLNGVSLRRKDVDLDEPIKFAPINIGIKLSEEEYAGFKSFLEQVYEKYFGCAAIPKKYLEMDKSGVQSMGYTVGEQERNMMSNRAVWNPDIQKLATEAEQASKELVKEHEQKMANESLAPKLFGIEERIPSFNKIESMSNYDSLAQEMKTKKIVIKNPNNHAVYMQGLVPMMPFSSREISGDSFFMSKDQMERWKDYIEIEYHDLPNQIGLGMYSDKSAIPSSDISDALQAALMGARIETATNKEDIEKLANQIGYTEKPLVYTEGNVAPIQSDVVYPPKNDGGATTVDEPTIYGGITVDGTVIADTSTMAPAVRDIEENRGLSVQVTPVEGQIPIDDSGGSLGLDVPYEPFHRYDTSPAQLVKRDHSGDYVQIEASNGKLWIDPETQEIEQLPILNVKPLPLDFSGMIPLEPGYIETTLDGMGMELDFDRLKELGIIKPKGSKTEEIPVAIMPPESTDELDDPGIYLKCRDCVEPAIHAIQDGDFCETCYIIHKNNIKEQLDKDADDASFDLPEIKEMPEVQHQNLKERKISIDMNNLANGVIHCDTCGKEFFAPSVEKVCGDCYREYIEKGGTVSVRFLTQAPEYIKYESGFYHRSGTLYESDADESFCGKIRMTKKDKEEIATDSVEKTVVETENEVVPEKEHVPGRSCHKCGKQKGFKDEELAHEYVTKPEIDAKVESRQEEIRKILHMPVQLGFRDGPPFGKVPLFHGVV